MFLADASVTADDKCGGQREQRTVRGLDVLAPVAVEDGVVHLEPASERAGVGELVEHDDADHLEAA